MVAGVVRGSRGRVRAVVLVDVPTLSLAVRRHNAIHHKHLRTDFSAPAISSPAGEEIQRVRDRIPLHAAPAW